jgi:hypothetical protein
MKTKEKQKCQQENISSNNNSKNIIKSIKEHKNKYLEYIIRSCICSECLNK